MRYLISTIILSLLGACYIYAANNTPDIKKGGFISGHVIEKNSEENIPFANIFIVETKQGATSNEAGHFEFKNMRLAYTPSVSRIYNFATYKKENVSRTFIRHVFIPPKNNTFHSINQLINQIFHSQHSCCPHLFF